ncbi:thioredoxin fold domain-containing protein [Flavobacteriaceae bacterium XHP0103]|uniref:thioredoxin family protein n=1 Tax=Marixanthotalea marina TaxID=2844359 RepID=UPI002989DB04|nr:thioredoxin fold domain-containing protein [Marixanthotalea marina]MBU3821052.1 thioredoxin fold domain-containing protein [Marixanthotalea marina]
MKRIIYILLLAVLVSVKGIAQEINWMTLEEAVALQKKSPKKIMMDVYTNWCGPCKMLDKNTFHNKDVVDYVNENYYAVKFNGEGKETITFNGHTFSNPNYDPARANSRNSAHQLTGYLQISAYPTIVFLDEKAGMIAPIRGYQQPKQLELYLKMFKKDDHKEIDTQEKFSAYYKAFTPQFRDDNI